jgi:hypothetical protein
VLFRLESHLAMPPSGLSDFDEAVRLAQRIARQQLTIHHHPRSFCHVLFMALARTRARTRLDPDVPASYQLTAA